MTGTSQTSSPLPLAVSIGEPAGIGADVILTAWQEHLDKETESLPPFLLLCDPDHLFDRAKILGYSFDFEFVDKDKSNSEVQNRDALRVLALENGFKARPGNPSSGDADGVIEAITRAVALVKNKTARAVVTLPINKKSLYDSGFDHPGHTEFLGELSKGWNGPTGTPFKPVMMLAGPGLRAVPVTVHIPLKDVPSALTTADIVETVRITAADLVSRFGIANPRIALSGLNPHAGEGGALGYEDETVIEPAVEQLKQDGINCFGPLPADTMFHPAARAQYDAAVCMYHDQALIPAKALAFDDTVNVTLGLPFVRTSPDHGTAFDIAGTGKANPASTIAALRLADHMTRDFASVSDPQ